MQPLYTGDETLTQENADDVLKELLPAQDQYYELGLELKLSQTEVDAIHSSSSEPGERLRQVIVTLLKPRPTWRVILDALRSPAVNLPRLAEEVEAAHLPTDKAPPSTTAQSPQKTHVTDLEPSQTLSLESSLTTPDETPEYKSVLEHYQQLLDTFKATPGSQERLLVQYKQKRWVDMVTNVTADEMIPKALNEIKYDKKNYSVFIKILKSITGLQEVVSSIKEKRNTLQKRPPCEMIRGSATTDHRFSYFTPSGSKSVYSYQLSTETWEELPPCPYKDSALVIINGKLTAVGGWDGFCYTNKLVILRERQWVEVLEEYPPMNTARSNAAVVSTSDDKYIIVIGGYVGDGWTATVELFHVSNREWYKLMDLPDLEHPSATVCGNQLHVIGGDNGYSCSLLALLSSDRPITSQSIPHLISWTSLPCLLVTQSTSATLSGQLVIIGGGQSWSSVISIHQLVNGWWVKIGSMSCDRRLCFVTSLSQNKILVVGGWGAEYSVEEVWTS